MTFTVQVAVSPASVVAVTVAVPSDTKSSRSAFVYSVMDTTEVSEDSYSTAPIYAPSGSADKEMNASPRPTQPSTELLSKLMDVAKGATSQVTSNSPVTVLLQYFVLR